MSDDTSVTPDVATAESTAGTEPGTPDVAVEGVESSTVATDSGTPSPGETRSGATDNDTSGDESSNEAGKADTADDPAVDPAELERLQQEHARETAKLNEALTQAEADLAGHETYLSSLQAELDRVEVSHVTGVPDELLIGCRDRAEVEQHAALLKQWRADNPIPQRPRGALKSGANQYNPTIYSPRQEAADAVRDFIPQRG